MAVEGRPASGGGARGLRRRRGRLRGGREAPARRDRGRVLRPEAADRAREPTGRVRPRPWPTRTLAGEVVGGSSTRLLGASRAQSLTGSPRSLLTSTCAPLHLLPRLSPNAEPAQPARTALSMPSSPRKHGLQVLLPICLPSLGFPSSLPFTFPRVQGLHLLQQLPDHSYVVFFTVTLTGQTGNREGRNAAEMLPHLCTSLPVVWALSLT